MIKPDGIIIIAPCIKPEIIRINLNSMKINMLQYAYEEFENIKGDNQNPLIQ
jgi:hypothetical protein